MNKRTQERSCIHVSIAKSALTQSQIDLFNCHTDITALLPEVTFFPLDFGLGKTFLLPLCPGLLTVLGADLGFFVGGFHH